jgi:hypothetical protein
MYEVPCVEAAFYLQQESGQGIFAPTNPNCFAISGLAVVQYTGSLSFVLHNYTGYNDVRSAMRGSSVLLTTGEHEYSRYGFQQLISSGCVDILQPDITWLGGITEARRVCAMASPYDTMVIGLSL